MNEASGHSPRILLSPSAIVAARIHQDMQRDARGKALRIWIADKNCDGFLYGVAFDAVRAGDHVLELESLRVTVDADCAPYLDGIQVDWVEDERGRGFLVTHPEQARYRGKFFLKGEHEKSTEPCGEES